MGQENFNASVQYNDMKGTAAADSADKSDLSKYLQDNKLIAEGEVLVGVQMYSGERTFSVQALVSSYAGYDNVKVAVESGKPLHVRKIPLELTLEQFFKLYKRFEVAISSHGVIDQKEITFAD